MITVVRAGPLSTVQDLGRPGWAHLGVPRSGALDAPALRLANRLVGNPEGCAGLETTLLGCAVRFDRPATVAVTGALADVRVDGAPGPFGAALAVPAGATVDVGRARSGVRSYLAVAGGIDVQPILGSRSTDTLSGLGPSPLTQGTVLPIAPAPQPGARDAGAAGAGRDAGAAAGAGRDAGAADGDGGHAFRTVAGSPPGGEVVLRVRWGPREDWVAAEAIAAMVRGSYTVTPVSNRVAARLAGPGLGRARTGELPSEGVVLGAVQVPADGQPLIFLADHPTTGGYPVVGVVDDVTALAQARPGTTVYFRDQD